MEHEHKAVDYNTLHDPVNIVIPESGAAPKRGWSLCRGNQIVSLILSTV